MVCIVNGVLSMVCIVNGVLLMVYVNGVYC